MDFESSDTDTTDDEFPKVPEHVLGLGNITSDDDDDQDTEDENSDKNESSSTSDNDDDDDLFQNKNVQLYESDEDDRLMGKKKDDYYGTDVNDVLLHKRSKKNQYRKGIGSTDILQEESWKLREKLASKIKPSSFTNLIDKDRHSKISSKKQSVCIDETFSNKREKEEQQALNDYEEIMEDLKVRLFPLIEASKKGLLPNSPCTEYLETRYFLSMNFMVVIGVYMLIKNSDNYHPKHPSIARMTQYRHLVKELNKSDDRFAPKLEALLKEYREGNLVAISHEKEISSEKIRESAITDSEEEEDMNIDNDDEKREMTVDNADDEDDTRYITYKIAKNKGLMPSRKKEVRNPRVKYRKKYLDKLKRRKGQVREVRTELSRYSGEKTGIKSFLVKSRKLK